MRSIKVLRTNFPAQNLDIPGTLQTQGNRHVIKSKAIFCNAHSQNGPDDNKTKCYLNY